MKKILFIFSSILLNIIIIFGMIYFFILSRVEIIEEGTHISKNIQKDTAKIILAPNSQLTGDIKLQTGNIILKNKSILEGNIWLENGKIEIRDNVTIKGNIYFNGQIDIGEGSKIEGNISKNAKLSKHSESFILGEKPNLFVTSDYPKFMKYFDSLPENHKNQFGYIFLTSRNMDIRENDIPTIEYFKDIFYYKDRKLRKINQKKDEKLMKKLYQNAKKFIEKIPERNIGRFGVGFVTKSGSFNKKNADMYISFRSATPSLFLHEYGHIMDYAYDFIDYHIHSYPYLDKENVVTDYGGFHKGEDFAEGYRFYVLHRDIFLKRTKENNILKDKYDFFKKYVFDGQEYN